MKSVELIISKVIQYKNGFVKDYAFINKETNTYNNLKEEIKKNIKSQLKDFRQKRLTEHKCRNNVVGFTKNISDNSIYK